MRKFLAVLALLLAGSGVVFADAIPDVVSSTTTSRWTRTVFNDSGGQLVSGQIVVWDTDDTEYDRSGYPYITTTTTADDIDTAGVMLNQTCADQTPCEIVVKGWALTDIPTGLTEDTVISTGTTAGRAADATAGNNVCYLGVLRENVHNPNTQVCSLGSVHCLVPVEVEVSCVA